MRSKLNYCAVALLALLIIGLASCKDDDYEYPPVKLEFMTAITGQRGKIEQVVTDNNRTLSVINDRTQTKVKADTTFRIISNYLEHEGQQAELYALAQVLAPIPMDPSAEELNGIIKTDPLEVMSISKGNGYINLVLSLKMENGKHLIHVIEEEVSMSSEGIREVKLLLYHDANQDPMSYSRRAYMSIPVGHYIEDGSTANISFSYYNLNRQRVDCTPINF